MDNIITIKNLAKSFGALQVLAGIDLEIPRGEITVIMGLSGTGKSVLLKHLLGLLAPDEGTLTIDGIDLGHATRGQREQILRKMGMCFQNAALFDSMTARENVAFPLREHFHLPEDQIGEKVDRALEMVGLREIGQKFPSELSGGMRKRVGLARALVFDPEIILFDEPTTGLDPVLGDVIIQTIARTHNNLGYTCIIVSHDLKLTFTIGHRVALLLKGRIAFAGTAEEFRDSDDPAVQQFIAGRSSGGPIEVQ